MVSPYGILVIDDTPHRRQGKRQVLKDQRINPFRGMKRRPLSLFHLSSSFLTTRRLLLRSTTSSTRGIALFGSCFYTTAICSTICQLESETYLRPPTQMQDTSEQVLRRWGCSDADIDKIFARAPSLKKANLDHLQSKLSLLRGLGLSSPDLVKMIHCRPRLLHRRLDNSFDERLEYLMELFGSGQVLAKAIVRNPSLLTYNLDDSIKPAVWLYENLGVGRDDLITMLLSRPTLIPRTSFNEEKIGYIHKTGIARTSKMYKYVVTLIGVSRLETIREKAAMLEKFGLSEEELWSFLGKNPFILTLSVDKVQRNMTFIVAVMKLPATVILRCPFLLFHNLETVLKPRWQLGDKIDDLGLQPRIKGNLLMTAMRMKENRFLKFYVLCHPKDVAEELLEFYEKVKGFRRLAEASKKTLHIGFPF